MKPNDRNSFIAFIESKPLQYVVLTLCFVCSVNYIKKIAQENQILVPRRKKKDESIKK